VTSSRDLTEHGARRERAEPGGRTEEEEPRFRAVFEGELDYVWSTLRRLGVQPADLEDVAHDVFLSLYRRMGDYDATRPLRPWVFGFSYRAAADYRKLARHRREVRADSERDVADPAPPADEQLAQHARHALFERALDALPLERRAVFVLHEVEGRTVAEIAATLGVPANTAGSRLRTARVEFAAAAKRLLRIQEEQI
jgi:RNA polymerase sigma-70 factor (ECF subfamily)